MEKAIQNEWKTMSRLAAAAWALVGVGIVALIIGFQLQTEPSSLAKNLTESEVIGVVLFLAFWVLGSILLGMVEHMKKKYDLVTYRDILAYSRGEEPARDNRAFSRRHPMAVAWFKFGVCAIAGGVIGAVVVRLFG